MNLKDRSRIRCYPADQISYIWDRVQPFIKKALDQGSTYTLTDVFYGLFRQEMQLWCWETPMIEAVMVTSIQSDDDCKFCLILALAGKNMDEWIRYLPVVESWAKDEGCKEMRIYGRIGWARKIGYDVQWTKMVREL